MKQKIGDLCTSCSSALSAVALSWAALFGPTSPMPGEKELSVLTLQQPLRRLPRNNVEKWPFFP